MKRRRRCRICNRLFLPDPRVGNRQRACGRAECQRERHRLACHEWRKKEQPALEGERLRCRLGVHQDELRLKVVQDECGLKVKVIIEECLRLVLAGVRDECPSIILDQRRESLRLVQRGEEDETDSPGHSP